MTTSNQLTEQGLSELFGTELHIQDHPNNDPASRKARIEKEIRYERYCNDTGIDFGIYIDQVASRAGVSYEEVEAFLAEEDQLCHLSYT